MHLECQTMLFLATVSVAESYRYECRDLRLLEGCCKSQRRPVGNCGDASRNHHVTPGVAESYGPAPQPTPSAPPPPPRRENGIAPDWGGRTPWSARDAPVPLLA